MRNDLQRKLDSIQKRIDKMQLMSDFLKRNPQIAARSTVKYLSGAYVGLVVDDKALIRPQGPRSNVAVAVARVGGVALVIPRQLFS